MRRHPALARRRRRRRDRRGALLAARPVRSARPATPDERAEDLRRKLAEARRPRPTRTTSRRPGAAPRRRGGRSRSSGRRVRGHAPARPPEAKRAAEEMKRSGEEPASKERPWERTGGRRSRPGNRADPPAQGFLSSRRSRPSTPVADQPHRTRRAKTPAASPSPRDLPLIPRRFSGRHSAGFVMNPVSTSTTGTFAQLKPVRSLRRTRPRLRAPVARTTCRCTIRRRAARPVDVGGPPAPVPRIQGRHPVARGPSSRPHGRGA